MNDSGRMGLFKRAGNLNRDVKNLGKLHRRPGHSFSQSDSVDKFRGDIVTT